MRRVVLPCLAVAACASFGVDVDCRTLVAELPAEGIGEVGARLGSENGIVVERATGTLSARVDLIAWTSGPGDDLLAGAKLRFEHDGGRARLVTDVLAHERIGVDTVRLGITDGAALDLDVTAGDVTLRGVTGPTLVRTPGRVVLERPGQVDIVSELDVFGELVGGGTIVAGEGAEVTVSGDDFAGVDITGRDEYDVTVHVPAGRGWQLDLASGAGAGHVEARLDGVQLVPAAGAAQLAITTGGGGPLLRLRASRGRVLVTDGTLP